MVLDRLADRAGWVGRGRERDAARVLQGRFQGLDRTLAHPLTYMTDSGIAVRKILARERAPLGDLLIVADDFALPFGKLRFREGGSGGGHNGLGSIIDELGTEKFSRLRVGIGEPDRHAIDHVLSRFSPDERQRLAELINTAADAVQAWAHDGTNKAANRFNAFELRPAAADARRAGDGQGRARRKARRVEVSEPGRGARRLPDLSVLPPLLAETGTFGSLRERLGSPDGELPKTGRHAGLTSVPHGAKSFLAAALALSGDRLCWIARDAEIGDRVAEELQAWLGDADRAAILEPRTALAYERIER